MNGRKIHCLVRCSTRPLDTGDASLCREAVSNGQRQSMSRQRRRRMEQRKGEKANGGDESFSALAALGRRCSLPSLPAFGGNEPRPLPPDPIQMYRFSGNGSCTEGLLVGPPISSTASSSCGHRALTAACPRAPAAAPSAPSCSSAPSL